MFRFLLVLFFSFFLFGGCSSPQPEIDKKEIAQEGPKQRTTEYDRILYEFGKMYRCFYGRDTKIYIQSKSIENVSGSGGLPRDLSQMIISAVNKIGKPIYYVPFDPHYIALEVQTGGSLSRNLPKYVIAGGITEYDKDIVSKSSGISADASGKIEGNEFDSSAEYSTNNSLSRLSLDLHLLDYQNQTMVPGTQTINTIELKRMSKRGGVNFFIFGSGIGFNGEVSRKQGTNAALRILVETSILQLLAREAGLPYWKITGGEKDPYVIEKVVDDLTAFNKAQLTKIIQVYLNRYGFKIDVTAKIDKTTDYALKRLSQDLNFTYNKKITPELAKDIWINQPCLPTDKHYSNADLQTNTPSSHQMKTSVSQNVGTPTMDYDTALQYIVKRIRSKAGSEKFVFSSMIDTATQSRTARADKIRYDILGRLNDNNKNYGQFADSNSRAFVKRVKKQTDQKNTISAYMEQQESSTRLKFILTAAKKPLDQFAVVYGMQATQKTAPKAEKEQPLLKEKKITAKEKQTEALVKEAGLDSEMKNDMVSLTTDRGSADPVFYAGETIRFRLSVKKPLYVHLFNINSDNQINLLYSSTKKLEPGKEYSIPSEKDNWEIVVEPPFGRDVIKLFATDKYVDFETLIKEKVKGKTRAFVRRAREKADEQKINYYEKGLLFETKK